MKVVDIQQRSPEWHEWRREGVSATSCAIIMDQNPEKTQLELWRELVGLASPPDLSVIPQVKRGVKFEPLALQAFEEQYGVLGLPICAESSDRPFIRASFDGLLADGSPVEIKNLSEANHLEVLSLGEKSKAYQLYRWQIMHQLIVSGASRGYLWFWSPKHTPKCLVVDRDDILIQRIIQAEEIFWNLVLTGTAPVADPKRDQIPHSQLDLKAWRVVAAQRRAKEKEIAELKQKLALAQKDAKELDTEFQAFMGDFCRAEAFGVRVTSYEVEGKVDWRSVAEGLGPAIPQDLIERNRSDPYTATRFTVDINFDEKNYKPDPMPRIRKPAVPADVEAPPKVLNGFWF